MQVLTVQRKLKMKLVRKCAYINLDNIRKLYVQQSKTPGVYDYALLVEVQADLIYNFEQWLVKLKDKIKSIQEQLSSVSPGELSVDQQALLRIDLPGWEELVSVIESTLLADLRRARSDSSIMIAIDNAIQEVHDRLHLEAPLVVALVPEDRQEEASELLDDIFFGRGSFKGQAPWLEGSRAACNLLSRKAVVSAVDLLQFYQLELSYRKQQQGEEPYKVSLEKRLEQLTETIVRELIPFLGTAILYTSKTLKRRTPAKAEEVSVVLERLKTCKQELESSFTLDEKIIAIDNTLNTWHIGFSVLQHLEWEYEADVISTGEEGLKQFEEVARQWEELYNFLQAQGKLPTKESTKRSKISVSLKKLSQNNNWLWAAYEGKVYTTEDIGEEEHADWFVQVGLPSAGKEFDRVARGIFNPDKDVLCWYPDTGSFDEMYDALPELLRVLKAGPDVVLQLGTDRSSRTPIRELLQSAAVRARLQKTAGVPLPLLRRWYDNQEDPSIQRRILATWYYIYPQVKQELISKGVPQKDVESQFYFFEPAYQKGRLEALSMTIDRVIDVLHHWYPELRTIFISGSQEAIDKWFDTPVENRGMVKGVFQKSTHKLSVTLKSPVKKQRDYPDYEEQEEARKRKKKQVQAPVGKLFVRLGQEDEPPKPEPQVTGQELMELYKQEVQGIYDEELEDFIIAAFIGTIEKWIKWDEWYLKVKGQEVTRNQIKDERKLLRMLRQAKTPQEKMVAIDRVINFVHVTGTYGELLIIDSSAFFDELSNLKGAVCTNLNKEADLKSQMLGLFLAGLTLFEVADRLGVDEAVVQKFVHDDPAAFEQVIEQVPSLKEVYNVTATIYHAVPEQTDSTPEMTADGTKIDITNIPTSESKRIVALSRDLLRAFTPDALFDYGDKITVEGVGELNGIWNVHDTMHGSITNTIDFLVPETIAGGKWEGVKIQKVGISKAAHLTKQAKFRASILQQGLQHLSPIVLAAGEPELMVSYMMLSELTKQISTEDSSLLPFRARLFRQVLPQFAPAVLAAKYPFAALDYGMLELAAKELESEHSG